MKNSQMKPTDTLSSSQREIVNLVSGILLDEHIKPLTEENRQLRKRVEELKASLKK